MYEMDTKMFIMNKTIQDILRGISFLQYESDLLSYFKAQILRLYSSLYAFKGDVDSLYEYMRALASQELNPMLILPDILKRYSIKLWRILSRMLDLDYVKTLKPTYGLITVPLN